MPPLTVKNLPKIGKKREKIREKREKTGKRGKIGKVLSLCPSLTDRAGYTTGTYIQTYICTDNVTTEI